MDSIDSLAMPLLFAVFAFFLFAKLKIAKDNERFAVHSLGQFRKLLGPGLLLKWSGSETKWHRLALGEIGNWVGGDRAQFGDCVVPVQYEEKPKRGVRIEGFEDERVLVAPSEVVSFPCEKCGHINHVSA